MTHETSISLGRRRQLNAGDEADVRFNGKTTKTRARFLYVDQWGGLVFTDPRSGNLRTVKPEAVGAIHRSTKLR